MKWEAAAQKIRAGVGSSRLREDRNEIGVMLGVRVAGDRMREASLPAEFETGAERAGFAEISRESEPSMDDAFGLEFRQHRVAAIGTGVVDRHHGEAVRGRSLSLLRRSPAVPPRA